MNKINNIKMTYSIYRILFSLRILSTILILLIFILTPFNMASADIPGYYSPQGGIFYSGTMNNPKPIIGSISPSSSNGGVGTKTITITGGGFVPSSVARINGSDRLTTFIDSSHLLVQSNGSDLARPDGFYVTVFNGAPGGGYSNADFFTIKNTVAPTITNTNNNTSPDTFTEINQTGNATNTNNDSKGNISNLAANAIFGSDSFMPSGLIQWIFIAIIVLLIVILVRRIFGGREKYQATPMKHD